MGYDKWQNQMPTETTFYLLPVRPHKRARACDAQNTKQAAH